MEAIVTVAGDDHFEGESRTMSWRFAGGGNGCRDSPGRAVSVFELKGELSFRGRSSFWIARFRAISHTCTNMCNTQVLHVTVQWHRIAVGVYEREKAKQRAHRGCDSFEPEGATSQLARGKAGSSEPRARSPETDSRALRRDRGR